MSQWLLAEVAGDRVLKSSGRVPSLTAIDGAFIIQIQPPLNLAQRCSRTRVKNRPDSSGETCVGAHGIRLNRGCPFRPYRFWQDHLDFRRSWGLGRCCGPGCGDGTDFVVGGLAWDGSGKPGRDDDPAELDEHVLEGRLGLVAVPRASMSAGSWPCRAYHTTIRVCTSSANGTVRSTASRLRLRASPAPRTLRASANACSTDHLIAYLDTIRAGPAAAVSSVVTSARS